MLQIIIWLGCAYLVFKGWEMKMVWDASQADLPEEQKGQHTNQGGLAFLLAILTAAAFVFLSLNQVSELPRY